MQCPSKFRANKNKIASSISYRKVVVLGASGNVGVPIVRALLSSIEPQFEVTILTRLTSNYTLPTDIDVTKLNAVSIIKTNLDDHPSLVKALTGQEALVIALPSNLVDSSKKLIDAAIDAGVKWILPSNFGNDDSPIPAVNRLFAPKKEVIQYLQEKAQKGLVTYNLIRTGPIFELAMKGGIGFDFKERKATIYEPGRTANITTLDSIATAIVGLLVEPSKFTNKILHIHDFTITQRDLLATAELVLGEKFEVKVVSIDEVGNAALESMNRGEKSMEIVMAVMNLTVWGERSSARWDVNDDSVSLGLEKVDLMEGVMKMVKTVEGL